MLKSSVAFFFGASLLSGMLMAQSSQPPQTPSTPQTPPASPVQPYVEREPFTVIVLPPAQNESTKKPRLIRIFIKVKDVPGKKPKELPIGILDAGRPA